MGKDGTEGGVSQFHPGAEPGAAPSGRQRPQEGLRRVEVWCSRVSGEDGPTGAIGLLQRPEPAPTAQRGPGDHPVVPLRPEARVVSQFARKRRALTTACTARIGSKVLWRGGRLSKRVTHRLHLGGEIPVLAHREASLLVVAEPLSPRPLTAGFVVLVPES